MSDTKLARPIPFRTMIVYPLVLAVMSGLSGCNRETSAGKTHQDAAGKPSFEQKGEASWYGPGFHGEETASGETFNQHQMTAAHPTLPLGTKAEVTNVETGKSVEVTINDRGPYAENRVIDLSKAAAKKLGMTHEGTAEVKIEAKPAKKTPGDKAKKHRKPTAAKHKR